MHNLIFCIIDKYDQNTLNNLKKRTSIIYRNYDNFNHENEILKIKKFCIKNKSKIYIANNISLAIKLKLDGIYIPSFNSDLSFLKKIKNLEVIGSAHNYKEIMIKKKQNVKTLFISPIFKIKKNKHFLDIYKFNLYSKMFNDNAIALGGINKKNIKKLSLTNSLGYASISLFKKK
jgi:thiamine-phosphate pyrophosphorylase